jgi:hypothetical protein
MGRGKEDGTQDAKEPRALHIYVFKSHTLSRSKASNVPRAEPHSPAIESDFAVAPMC